MNDDQLDRIRAYIFKNPANWDANENNPQNKL